MRPAVLLGMAALLWRAAYAQVAPDVAEILKKVSETYQVSQYELAAEQTLKLPGNQTPAHAHVHVAFKGPNRYRLEGLMPDLANDDPNLVEGAIVHDGSTLWIYFPESNQYGSIPADELAADNEGSAHTPEATDRVLMQKYRAAADFIDGAKLVRQEEIEFAGEKVGCYVVSVPQKWPGPYTWWIDKRNAHVLREATSDGATDYTMIKLGDPLPDSLFQFRPPPGAKKIGAKVPYPNFSKSNSSPATVSVRRAVPGGSSTMERAVRQADMRHGGTAWRTLRTLCLRST